MEEIVRSGTNLETYLQVAEVNIIQRQAYHYTHWQENRLQNLLTKLAGGHLLAAVGDFQEQPASPDLA